jgi:hypothetical protein
MAAGLKGDAIVPQRHSSPWSAGRRVVVLLLLQSVAACAPVNPQASVLIEYRRSGGIAGREDRLVIRSDGTARLTRRGTDVDFSVAADTLARVRALIDSARFSTLRAEYLPARRGADLFEYVVTCQGRTVRTMDTAVPDRLQPLLQLLAGLIASRR